MAEDITKTILIEIEANTDQLKQNVTELSQSLDGLHQKQKQLAESGQQSSKAFQDLAVQLKAAQSAIESHGKAIDAGTKLLSSSKSELQQNKTLLEVTKQRYQEVANAQGDSSRSAKALNVEIGTLTNTIARQEQKLADSRKVFDLHKGTADALKSSFDKLKNVSGDFGPSLKEAADGFDYLKTGLSVVKTGFTGVGEAIKATGFGLLVLVLQSVVEYLTKTKEGSQMLKGAISAVGKIVELVKKAFASLKETMINAITHPVESIKRIGTLLEQNIINRFRAFSVILDGIVHLNFKKMADGAIQAFTSVTGATDKIAHSLTTLKTAAVSTWKDVNKAYTDGAKHAAEAANAHVKADKKQQSFATNQKNVLRRQRDDNKKAEADKINDQNEAFKEQLQTNMEKYTQELSDTDEQYRQLSAKYKDFLADYNDMTDGLKKEHQEEYNTTTADLLKLDADRASKRFAQTEEYNEKMSGLLSGQSESDNSSKRGGDMLPPAKSTKNLDMTPAVHQPIVVIDLQNTKDNEQKKTDIVIKAEKERRDFAISTAQQVSGAAFNLINSSIKQQSDAKIKGLEADKAKELSNLSLTGAQKLVIQQKYKQQESQVKLKAFKDEQRASIAQALINGAIAVTKAEAQTGVLGAFVIPAIIAQTAIQVTTIASQKPPQYATGGLHYASDGKGAVLPGYSRGDNTNAYLRSGEAVVVSEAMRDPWARNLVSAINVAYGGRDFSVTNPTRGYAVGGIFTDGGNSNRYYNQPMNDQKNLANTIAYQMINNFPPIYVDVKDVNNQQNILAQTVNRVNL